MTKVRRISKQQQLQKCQDTIDNKFADIQKYINGISILNEKTKGNMITLCMICNDSIISTLEMEQL